MVDINQIRLLAGVVSDPAALAAVESRSSSSVAFRSAGCSRPGLTNLFSRPNRAAELGGIDRAGDAVGVAPA